LPWVILLIRAVCRWRFHHEGELPGVGEIEEFKGFVRGGYAENSKDVLVGTESSKE
jgi:hypothetical protein